MLRACLATFVAAALAAPAVPEDMCPRDPHVAAGIALVKEGDFASALLMLDTVARRLEGEGTPGRDLALAYVYLGVAYLGLGQEPSARTCLRAALATDPAIGLDPRELPLEAIRAFDSVRKEAETARAVPPAPSKGVGSPVRKRPSVRPYVLLVGGAVAGIAAATAGGGSSATATTVSEPTTTTTTTTTVPSASCACARSPEVQTVVSSLLDVQGARGQVLLDGLTPAFQGRGRAQVERVGRPGIGRIEAQLVSASGQPGTWTFEMSGAFEAGGLRIVAGDVASVTAGVIVFRIAGRMGERVVFTFRAKAP